MLSFSNVGGGWSQASLISAFITVRLCWRLISFFLPYLLLVAQYSVLSVCRAEIKASGKVCWGVVLSKFQDPQSHGNGSTIPIKPNHKYFPVKQENEPATSDELWNLLHKHVASAYGSFKNAFLQLDQVRNTGQH